MTDLIVQAGSVSGELKHYQLSGDRETANNGAFAPSILLSFYSIIFIYQKKVFLTHLV